MLRIKKRDSDSQLSSTLDLDELSQRSTSTSDPTKTGELTTQPSSQKDREEDSLPLGTSAVEISQEAGESAAVKGETEDQ